MRVHPIQDLAAAALLAACFAAAGCESDEVVVPSAEEAMPLPDRAQRQQAMPVEGRREP